MKNTNPENQINPENNLSLPRFPETVTGKPIVTKKNHPISRFRRGYFQLKSPSKPKNQLPKHLLKN